MTEPIIRAAAESDFAALRALLGSNGLPSDDLRVDRLADFLLVCAGETLIASVGLDVCRDIALLRSLAVADAWRGQGWGERLVTAIEHHARQRGVHTLYLLTTSAEAFFLRRGYTRCERRAAPPAIAAMPQFSNLCPASSAFLHKSIGMRRYNVLFLCTANSARSILAEAAVNHDPRLREHFQAFSAGSHPRGEPNPYAIELLEREGVATAALRSKSWDEFAVPGAPSMDFIITVCDAAAGETCPYWPGQPISAHWGMPDPAAADGEPAAIRAAFADTLAVLRARMARLAQLPLATLARDTLQQQLREIGQS